MATAPLVIATDDTGPLLKLSLVRHRVAIDDVFEIIEELTGERYFAVATPLTEQKGFREAYLHIFTAIGNESFSSIPFLRLHTLVISHEEFLAIRRAVKKDGTGARFPKLLQLGEVSVYPVDDPAALIRSGLLVVHETASGSIQAQFHPVDRHLAGKKRSFDSLESFKNFLQSIDVVARPSPSPAHTTTIAVGTSLANLYDQELI